MENPKEFYPTDIPAWRAWLESNHSKESKIGVIRYKKHTGKNSPTHLELMHEAICFGWIDTTVNRIDEDKYKIHFSKRGKNGRWSNNTLSYAKAMIKQGKMSPAGLHQYELGLKRPVLGHGIPANPKTPKDLMKLLNSNQIAFSKFKSLSPSNKRINLRWILSAKLPETRTKRIKRVYENMLSSKKSPF